MARRTGTDWRRVAREWAPFVPVPVAYAVLNRVGDRFTAKAHVQPQLAFDELLFGGTVPTVRLQRELWDPDDPRWWDLAAWLVYLSHFVVTVAVALALWFKDAQRFRR